VSYVKIRARNKRGQCFSPLSPKFEEIRISGRDKIFKEVGKVKGFTIKVDIARRRPLPKELYLKLRQGGAMSSKKADKGYDRNRAKQEFRTAVQSI